MSEPITDYWADEILLGYNGWLHATAAEMVPFDAPRYEDVVQEGRIAMWRALLRADLDNVGLAGYLTTAARGRMLDVASGRKVEVGTEKKGQTGGTQANGTATRDRIRVYLREHPTATGTQIARDLGLSKATVSYQSKRLNADQEIMIVGSVDAFRESGSMDIADPEGDLLDHVMRAYAAGVISQALDVLTPNERKYIVLRFWGGADPAELRREFGYEPNAIWRSAKQRLTPVLERLIAA